MGLGNRLKYLREKAGYTQGFIADFLKLKVKASISAYEKETSEPSITSILKLADLYKVDLRWLLRGEGGPKEYLIDNPEINSFKRPQEYRVLGSVPAGIGELQSRTEYYESDILDFSPADHAFVQVDKEFGYSMMPTIQPGDLCLISFSATVKNLDLVAAKWDDTKGAIKVVQYYDDEPSRGVLTSYNPATPAIPFRKDKCDIYKVVLIKKR